MNDPTLPVLPVIRRDENSGLLGSDPIPESAPAVRRTRQARPEPFVIVFRFGAQGIVGFHAGNSCLLNKLCRRSEYPGLFRALLFRALGVRSLGVRLLCICNGHAGELTLDKQFIHNDLLCLYHSCWSRFYL